MFSLNRRTLIGFLALSTFVASAAVAAAPRPFPADGPRFNAKGQLSWDQYRGKVVVVDFWNHH
jgi:hypothetical protein